MQRVFLSLWKGGQAAGWAGCPGAGQRAAQGPLTHSAAQGVVSAPAQGLEYLCQLPALALLEAPELMPPVLKGVAESCVAAVQAMQRQESPFTVQRRP